MEFLLNFDIFELTWVFVFGLCFGSFANVCIYRMPRDISIVKPNSHCPNCKNPIKWYDNIPVLSYIYLRAKCRNCGEKISAIYPCVELFCGFLFVSMYFLFGYSYVLIPFCFLVFSLMIATAIDFEFYIIPDEISFSLMIIGFATSWFNYVLGDTILERMINSFSGFLAGGGSLYLVAVLGKILFKKDAMGGGDIKIMAGVGTFLGWDRVLLAIAIACFLGSIIGIFLIIFKKIVRKQEIAFGPYLAVGSYLVLFMPKPAVVINVITAFEESLLTKYIFH